MYLCKYVFLSPLKFFRDQCQSHFFLRIISCVLCSSIACNQFSLSTSSLFRKSYNYYIPVVMLLAVVSADNCNCYWEMSCDDNHRWMLSISDDLNVLLVAGNEHEPAALISDVFFAAHCPFRVVDDVDRFLLVVISVAYVSRHIYRIEYQLSGKPLVADSTIDMALIMIVMLIQSNVLCNLLHPMDCYYTNTDDLRDHLLNHSYNDKSCNERTSYPILCRFRSLYNLVRMHMSLFDSILPDKIPDNIWNDLYLVHIT